MNTGTLINFLSQIDALKTADHRSLLALAVMHGQGFANEEINLERALKMALIHDLAQEKTLVEILEPLGEPLAQEIYDLWIDIEKRECPESRFVTAFDRFLTLLSHFKTEGQYWKKYKITHKMVIQKNAEIISEGSSQLWLESQKLLGLAMQQKFLAPS